jgi:hypothetical protein
MFKPDQTPASQTPVSFCSPWFKEYAITLPEDSAPLLKGRLFTVIMHRLYDVRCPHDMSLDLLNNLHDLLTADQRDDDDLHEHEHLLLLNELQLSVLKRFCQAERQLAGQHRPRMNRSMSNHGYWLLLGELLEYCERDACRLQNLSFFA